MALKYPTKETRLPGFITLDVVDGNLSETGTQFQLPIPQGLAIGDAASYENADLGLKGLFMTGSAHGGGTQEEVDEKEATQSQAEQQSKDDPNKKGTAGRFLTMWSVDSVVISAESQSV